VHGSIDRSLMGFYGGMFSLGLGSGLSCWGRVILNSDSCARILSIDP
jgi:hypothetical protein